MEKKSLQDQDKYQLSHETTLLKEVRPQQGSGTPSAHLVQSCQALIGLEFLPHLFDELSSEGLVFKSGPGTGWLWVQSQPGQSKISQNSPNASLLGLSVQGWTWRL